jgi:hypothetical protein
MGGGKRQQFSRGSFWGAFGREKIEAFLGVVALQPLLESCERRSSRGSVLRLSQIVRLKFETAFPGVVIAHRDFLFVQIAAFE